jgi:5'-deoxynucleotidase YfbR-like HD superfamily hydrolase
MGRLLKNAMTAPGDRNTPAAWSPPKGDTWMQTFTGKKVWIGAPRPEDIEFDDIAHHLSMLCRFGGASRRFYSVAEHSVLVSHLVPHHLALPALFHDSPETYLGDVIRPVKMHCPEYKRLERRFASVIAQRLGLEIAELAPEILDADVMALYHESVDLLHPALRADWKIIVPQELRNDLRQLGAPEIQGLAPDEAKKAFINRCLELTAPKRKR